MSSYKPFLISTVPCPPAKKKSVIVLAALHTDGTVCLQGCGECRQTPRKTPKKRANSIIFSPSTRSRFPSRPFERERQTEGKKKPRPQKPREKETNDLLTPFSPGPDRQNGPSPACSRVTRNGPLANEKDTSLLSTSSTTAWTHCGGPNYPNIEEPGLLRRLEPSPILERQNTRQGQKRGERAASRPKRRRHVSQSFASFSFSSVTNTKRKKTLRLSVFCLASLYFSLFKKGQGTMTKLKTKKKAS
ncbi:hypothetical protein V8C43DRAFT_263656 [Trichoderma afarasin]